MYRGRPLWRCPWDRAFQLGQRKGPIMIVGPMTQPRGIIDTASLTLYHTHAFNMRFLKQLYSRQLRVASTLIFFVKGALFRGKGGPPVLEEPARHRPRQGQGFVRPPVCPTPPPISSTYGRASGSQLTDCWHQISSCGQCILCLCYCIVCRMS